MPVKEGWRGRFFEDFEVGDIYEHPLGRTVTTIDNLWFTLLTQNTAAVPLWRKSPPYVALRSSRSLLSRASSPGVRWAICGAWSLL